MSKLSNEESVILFKEHSGEISAEEIYKLIMMQDNYPIDKEKLGFNITKEQFKDR